MNSPSSLQAEQLGRILSRVAPFDPIVSTDARGAIHVKPPYGKFVICDADSMDELLNELDDVDSTLDPDDRFDQVMEFLANAGDVMDN